MVGDALFLYHPPLQAVTFCLFSAVNLWMKKFGIFRAVD